MSKEEEEERKKRKKVVRFDKLPFHVVTDEIMSFYKYTADNEDDDAQYYGKFNKDKSEFLFMIFKSIALSSRPMEYLRVNEYYPGPDVLTRLKSIEFNMYSTIGRGKTIKTLEGGGEVISEEGENLFKYFKNLQSLSIINNDFHVNLNEGGENWKFMKSLTFLNLVFCKGIRNDTFRHLKQLVHLEMFDCGIELREGEEEREDVTQFPENVITGYNWLNMRKLEVVSFSDLPELRDFLFTKESSKNIRSIFLWKCGKIIGTQWTMMERVHTCIAIDCESITDDLFIKIPNVIDLTLERSEETNNLRVRGNGWPEYKKLKEFSLTNYFYVKNTIFTYMINLEKLVIRMDRNVMNSLITGTDWNVFERMKEITIIGCPNFNTDVFEYKMRNVEIIDIKLTEPTDRQSAAYAKFQIIKTRSYWENLQLDNLKSVYINHLLI